ncbi:unnamed protein product [Peniophora sp. CBMAI 1063]|nr:unnamed protein product [Peniophora sp. CBMAI 1063]
MMADPIILSDSSVAMRAVLKKLFKVERSILAIPGAYEDAMTQQLSPYLKEFVQYLDRRAIEEVTVGRKLQIANGLPREHVLVLRHYRSGAGYIQLRLLALQGLKVLYAAITQDYVLFEGNQFTAEVFYTDFGISE